MPPRVTNSTPSQSQRSNAIADLLNKPLPSVESDSDSSANTPQTVPHPPPSKRPRACKSAPTAAATHTGAGVVSSSPSAKGGSAKAWNADGGGLHPTSLRLLLAWMAKPGSVDAMKGGDGTGRKIAASTEKISKYIKRRNPLSDRTPLACKKKYNELHASWATAADWKGRSGNGAGEEMIAAAPLHRRSEVEEEVMDRVRAMCPEWDDLDPIFQNKDGGSAYLRGQSTGNVNAPLDLTEGRPVAGLPLPPSSQPRARLPRPSPLSQASQPSSHPATQPIRRPDSDDSGSEDELSDTDMREVERRTGRNLGAAAAAGTGSVAGRLNGMWFPYEMDPRMMAAMPADTLEDEPGDFLDEQVANYEKGEVEWRQTQAALMTRQAEAGENGVKAKLVTARLKAAEMLLRDYPDMSLEDRFARAKALIDDA